MHTDKFPVEFREEILHAHAGVCRKFSPAIRQEVFSPRGEKYADLVELTGYEYQSLANYASIARSFPVEVREEIFTYVSKNGGVLGVSAHTNLSWVHFLRVQGLESLVLNLEKRFSTAQSKIGYAGSLANYASIARTFPPEFRKEVFSRAAENNLNWRHFRAEILQALANLSWVHFQKVQSLDLDTAKHFGGLRIYL